MKRFTIIISLLVAGHALFAQDSTAIKKLSFKEAIQIGLENNVTLETQKNQQYVNQSQKTAAIANMAPSINASAQAWKTLGNQFIEQEARVVNDARTNNVFATVNAQMVLFNGLNRISALSESDARLDAQQFFVKRTQQDVISQISRQFLQCLLDQEALRIEEQSLALQLQQLTQIKEQVQLGGRAEVDAYTQEFQVKDAELRVLRARTTLRNDKATLANTIQMDPSIDFELIEPEWNTSVADLSSVSLEQLMSQAETSRADLLRAKELEVATKKNMRVNVTRVMPTLSAFASFNSRYSNASAPPFDDQFSDNKRTTYGLQLDIPIFNNWQNRSTYVQSRVNYQNAKLTTASTETTVKSDVLRAYQNYRDAIASYEASSAQVQAAELNFKFQKERYDLAITDLIQYTQATRDYVQAQTNFAQAKYTLMFQKVLMDYAVGTLKPEDLPE